MALKQRFVGIPSNTHAHNCKFTNTCKHRCLFNKTCVKHRAVWGCVTSVLLNNKMLLPSKVMRSIIRHSNPPRQVCGLEILQGPGCQGGLLWLLVRCLRRTHDMAHAAPRGARAAAVPPTGGSSLAAAVRRLAGHCAGARWFHSRRCFARHRGRYGRAASAKSGDEQMDDQA